MKSSKFQNGFMRASYLLARDKNISLKAKGIYLSICSLPPDWRFSADSLAAISRGRVNAVRSGLKELEAAGYLTRKCKQGAGGKFTGSEYCLTEPPSNERFNRKPFSRFSQTIL